jgi:uncharacterized protein
VRPVAALVLASGVSVDLEIADTRKAKARGLLGRDSCNGGAMLITPCRNVHTMQMRFAVDVAHLSAATEVLCVRTMKPWRVGPIVWKGHSVLEADAGSFARWGIAVGDVLEIRP